MPNLVIYSKWPAQCISKLISIIKIIIIGIAEMWVRIYSKMNKACSIYNPSYIPGIMCFDVELVYLLLYSKILWS